MILDTFRRQKGWSYSELARQVDASHATVARRWCLPFGHKDRLIPNELFMDRIVLLSNGEVVQAKAQTNGNQVWLAGSGDICAS
jgi:hypothetical protein